MRCNSVCRRRLGPETTTELFPLDSQEQRRFNTATSAPWGVEAWQ